MAKARAHFRGLSLLTLVAAILAVNASIAIAATTTYTGVWAGGTIAPGNTVVLNNGATVTDSVVANGTLQFNQSGTTLTLTYPISGTGTLSITNSGTLLLEAESYWQSDYFVGLDMTTLVSAGQLRAESPSRFSGLSIGHSGTGTIHLTGGLITSNVSVLGFREGGSGTGTVSSGTWDSLNELYIGREGTGTLNMSGGLVTSSNSSILRVGSSALVTGGTWATTNALTVSGGHYGPQGEATLLVSGGLVTSSTGFIGRYGWANATVSSGTWANSGNLYLGDQGNGALNVAGGLVTTATTYINFYMGTSVASVSSGTWVNSGDLVIGSGNAAGTGKLNVTGGLVTSANSYLAASSATYGTAVINSGTWINSGDLYVGTKGIGALHISGGLVTSSNSFIGADFGSVGTAVVSSGTWATTGNLHVGGSGTGALVVSGGIVTVGGTLSTGVRGTVDVGEGGTLQIGTGGATGVFVANPTINGVVVFQRSDEVAFLGTMSGTGIVVNAGAGVLSVPSRSFTNGLVATKGHLIAGDAAAINGFATTGILAAAEGTMLELKSRGLAYVNGLSTLTGGTIRAANGISLGAGANVVGAGTISGFVSAVQGSRIEADGGKLTAGDAGSFIGFSSDGLLYTNANEVELLDRNTAVLGSLTQLGNGASGGSLRAVNGMLLEQGKNLVGRGTVYGNFVNQGVVYGDGPTSGQQLVFAAGSTVSGNGSFTNALFNGTYAPGNSPAITNLTNGGFASSSTLLIEIGGTQAGAQYDQVQNTGTLSLLGGTLNVLLTNSFMPAPGDSFQILGYGQLAGDFGMVNLPVFDNGLGWQRVTTGTSMRLVAIRLPVSIDVSSGSETLASSGYSSLAYAASLSKTGAGTLILSATDSFTGTTSIQKGILAITSTAAISGSPLVSLTSGASLDVSALSGGYTVPSGQTLAGAGTVLGSVTFGRGSTLSPGMFSAASRASMLAADTQAGSLQALVVPEPATLGLVGGGLGFLGLRALRRKRVARRFDKFSRACAS